MRLYTQKEKIKKTILIKLGGEFLPCGSACVLEAAVKQSKIEFLIVLLQREEGL